HGPRVSTVVATLVVERALDGLAIGLILATSLTLVPTPREIAWAAEMFGAFVFVLLLALVVIAVAPLPCRIFIHSLMYRWPAIELALSFFGVARADALSFSLLLHAAQFVPVTVWGLALLVVEHVSLSAASQRPVVSASE